MTRLRALIARQIDQAIERAIASYQAFAAAGPNGADAKEFAAHHAACKAALAHLDLLLKIARITETPTVSDGDERLALLAEARAAVGVHGAERPNEDDA